MRPLTKFSELLPELGVLLSQSTHLGLLGLEGDVLLLVIFEINWWLLGQDNRQRLALGHEILGEELHLPSVSLELPELPIESIVLLILPPNLVDKLLLLVLIRLDVVLFGSIPQVVAI